MKDSTIDEQIKKIEEEIFNTQKNKATEHHIGKLKAKIARLREVSDKRKSTSIKGKGFAIKKSGDATIGLIGFPSVGKSTLLNKLTDANSKREKPRGRTRKSSQPVTAQVRTMLPVF